jgi:hypothetical protein
VKQDQKPVRQEFFEEIPELPQNPFTRQQKIDILIETASRREQQRQQREDL